MKPTLEARAREIVESWEPNVGDFKRSKENLITAITQALLEAAEGPRVQRAEVSEDDKKEWAKIVAGLTNENQRLHKDNQRLLNRCTELADESRERMEAALEPSKEPTSSRVSDEEIESLAIKEFPGNDKNHWDNDNYNRLISQARYGFRKGYRAALALSQTGINVPDKKGNG